MITYTKLNDPKEYRNYLTEAETIVQSTYEKFSVSYRDKIRHTFVDSTKAGWDKEVDKIDTIDQVIVEEIARSKYLTADQIRAWLLLRGIQEYRQGIDDRIEGLVKARIIQEKTITGSQSFNLRFYELDYWGYQLALKKGIIFHRGNHYLSYKTQCKNDCVATPADVKRILQGNQIVLGLLAGGAESKRFGLMETIRPETGERLHHDCILRTTANVKVDEASVLAYEVVRNTDESYEKLADKVERYDLLLQNKKYLQSNYHGDLVYPQLIICGESLQHNIKISNYLESRCIWSEEDTVLFTDDRLNRNDPLRSIYAIREGKKIRRYALPGIEKSSLLKRSLFLSD